jgi:hypothetical protein
MGKKESLGLLAQDRVGVEKVQFAPKQPELGGCKMSRKSRNSFIGHPNRAFKEGRP